MREKVLLRRRVTPRIVNLPNESSFVARYERVSGKSFPSNVIITQKKTIGPRQQRRQTKRKQQRVAFASLADQVPRSIARKYRKQRSKQRGDSLLSSFAGGIANIGAKNLFKRGMDIGSKAITSEIGKNLTD